MASLDLVAIGDAVEQYLGPILREQANARLIVFPDGDFMKTGKTYVGNSVIFTIAANNWTPPTNSRSLSSCQSQQLAALNVQFYLSSTRLNDPRQPGSIFGMYDIILQNFRDKRYAPNVGLFYPTSFAFAQLNTNCEWEYDFIWSLDYKDAQENPNIATQSPASAWG